MIQSSQNCQFNRYDERDESKRLIWNVVPLFGYFRDSFIFFSKLIQ